MASPPSSATFWTARASSQGGSTRLIPVDVLANGARAVAIIEWSATYKGWTLHGREFAHYEIRDGRITEAWFYPWDNAASDAFLATDSA